MPSNRIKDSGGQVAAADERTEVPSVLRKLTKWADYPSMGLPVWPSRFIPTKTPLSAAILSEWDEDAPCKHPHTVATMLAHCKASQWNLGMILNLASHESLYDCDLPADSGLETRHVELTSKMLPSPQAMAEVIQSVRDFWRRRPDDYIAIHCAYGFNRTGFTVCCYLIQELGLSVNAALQSFAMSRPPGIKHEKFVTELHNRFYGVRPAIPVFDAALHAPFYACSSSDGQAQLECLRMAHRQAAEVNTVSEDSSHEQRWLPQNQHITPNLSHCDLVAHVTGDENELLEPTPEQAAHNQEVNNDSIGRDDAKRLLKALEKHRASQRSGHSPDRGSAASPCTFDGDRDCFDAIESALGRCGDDAARATTSSSLAGAATTSSPSCARQDYLSSGRLRRVSSLEVRQAQCTSSACDTPAVRCGHDAASLDAFARNASGENGGLHITSHALLEQDECMEGSSGSDTAVSTSLTPRPASPRHTDAQLGSVAGQGNDARTECSCQGVCERCRSPHDGPAAGMHSFAGTSGRAHTLQHRREASAKPCASATTPSSWQGDSPQSSSAALAPHLVHHPQSAMCQIRGGGGAGPEQHTSAAGSQQTQISAETLPRAGSDLSMELGNCAHNRSSKATAYSTSGRHL